MKFLVKIFVICDEIFKGTNIKDAFDATKVVIEGFLVSPRSYFLLSSHLVELAEEIKREKVFF